MAGNQVLGVKREAEEAMEQNSSQAKKPRLVAGAKVLPRRPSGELLHREPHLQALHAALARRASQRAVDVAITGTAGVGKTELVLNFVASHADEFQHVLWINAESKQTAESSVLETAKMLEMGEVDNVHMPLLLTKMYRLCSESKCLVVFDNAASPEMLQEFLPPFHLDKSSLFTVVTSQFVDWDCETQLSVACFSPEQSQLFLTSHLEGAKASEAEIVSEKLGNLPLALKMAVSYIKYESKVASFDSEEYTLRHFMYSLENDSCLSFLEHKLSKNENLDYSKPLLKIFDMTLENVKKFNQDIDATQVLPSLAYVKPNGISSILVNYLSDDPMERKYDFDNKCFVTLEKFSLLKGTDHEISISPILQMIIRLKHSSNEKKEYLETHLQFIFGTKTFINCYSIHCLESFSYETHTEIIWNFSKTFPELVENYSIIPLAFANEQVSQGKFSDCLQFIERQIDSYKSLLGPNHEHVLEMYMPYVFSLSKLKQHEKVITICSEVFPKLVKKENTYFDILYFRARSLYKLNNLDYLDQSLNLGIIVYKKQKENDMKTLVSAHLDTLKLVCAIETSLYAKDPKKKLLEHLTKLMVSQLQEVPCLPETVDLLPRIEKYFVRIKQLAKMFHFYQTLEKNPTLNGTACDQILKEKNLNNKAKFARDHNIIMLKL